MPELIEYPCGISSCPNKNLGFYAICDDCHQVRCIEHNNAEYHICKNKKSPGRKEIYNNAKRDYFQTVLNDVTKHQQHFLNEINILRPDHHPTLVIPPSVDSLLDDGTRGGFNLHFKITFDVGVKWLLRVRQSRGHRPPPELADAVIQSEVATLNVLKSQGIPFPKAFLPLHLTNVSERKDESSAVPPLDYFYYESMSGTPMNVPRSGYIGKIELPKDQLRHFIEEFAKVQISLSNLKLPYKHIGCIYPSKDGYGTSTTTGPTVARGCFMNPTPPYLLGPFVNQKERYLAHIDAALRYISVNALQGSGIDEYLWHLELRELVTASKILGEDPGQLYVKHDDEKGDHLMVDDGGKVVGILDWEWAYVTTKAEAFSTPYIFNRTGEYIFLGSNEMTEDEKSLIETYVRLGREDLADCVRNGRLYTRLQRIGQYDKAYKKSGFREVFDVIPSDFDPPKTDADWTVYMIRRYAHDVGLQGYMAKYEWSLERAEKEAMEWHEKNDKKEK
ncbi:hypothetical protein I302_102422 [Kwoniella bestiolae CBS 10118]|uniref:Aminoglycoside phosphotransferase domain-containing protein n=1 Tax=Kwoniella bestiolae CBS 10118 TaxID=1296100 RepID=A0A1B9GEZ8_9TREE|nr:hypothetical protein I302_01112 [Kwoniella bestiolae CBS 10118]OCF29603.1 hypothetical protein I302_01112 [Kwoniella bestiolae CBS 10118]